MLRPVARRVLPARVRAILGQSIASSKGVDADLARMRRNVWTKTPGSCVRCGDYTVRINDGPNFYVLYKDIFCRRIYHFESEAANPRILDCGSNIGLSVLYFKQVFPQARITAFEPDPGIFPYLEENVACNGFTDVQLVRAAVSSHAGMVSFESDGKYSGCLTKHRSDEIRDGWTRHEVPCVELREYLAEPVDFLKMNIEGAEWDVLSAAEDRLRQVREMVIEYHHLPGLPRTLHDLLALLHRRGFEYLINDFDAETNGEVRPPFQLTPESRYFLLVYAKRSD